MLLVIKMETKDVLAELFLNKFFPKLSIGHFKHYFGATHDSHFFSCFTCIDLSALFQPYDARANKLEKTRNSAANSTLHLLQGDYFQVLLHV